MICVVQLMFSAAVLALEPGGQRECPAQIRLPYNSSWLPYVQVTDENVTGTDIELIRQLLNAVGSQIQFVPLPESRALMHLETGQADLLFAASFTEERARYAWFTQPYREEINVVVVHQRLLDQYPEIKQKDAFFDLVNRRLLGAFNPTGYYGPEFEQLKQLPTVQKRTVAIFNDIQRLEMVLNQRADFTLADQGAIRYQLQQSTLYQPLQILPFELHRDQIRLMLSKKTISEACLATLDKAIRQLPARP